MVLQVFSGLLTLRDQMKDDLLRNNSNHVVVITLDQQQPNSLAAVLLFQCATGICTGRIGVWGRPLLKHKGGWVINIEEVTLLFVCPISLDKS